MNQESTMAQTNVDDDNLHDRKEQLISAALSLTHVIEVLSSAELSAELRLNLTEGVDFYREVTRFEVRLIEDAMRLAKGNQLRASALLGLKHTTLNSMLKRYRIDRRAFATYLSKDSLEQLQQSKFYRVEMVEDRVPATA